MTKTVEIQINSNIQKSLDIVLELARQNLIDDPEMLDEKKRQNSAILTVERFSMELFNPKNFSKA